MNQQFIKDFVQIMPLMHRKLFHGLRRSQFKKNTGVLMTLLEDEGQTMSYYCEKLVISKPNFTKLINELLEEGFVERVHDENDRRRINIYLTVKGRKEVEERKAFVYNIVEEKLSQLDKDDLKKLHEHVLGVQEIIGKL